MAPRAKTSARASIRSTSPFACSGGMYAGVPMTLPARVSESGVRSDSMRERGSWGVALSSRGTRGLHPPLGRTFASPQSMTCTSPNAPTMTFAGLRSRWMTPLLWAKATVWQISEKVSKNENPPNPPTPFPEGKGEPELLVSFPVGKGAVSCSPFSFREGGWGVRSSDEYSGRLRSRIARSLESVFPLISFIARNGRPLASVPRSCTGAMPGCWSWAVILASSTNRAATTESTG